MTTARSAASSPGVHSVCVITPSIGSSKLLDAMESVSRQTYRNLRHLVVADGPAYEEKIKELQPRDKQVNAELQIAVSPENTGAGGFNGQRIYAAYPHLINEDYIAFLDEDNWYEPDHLAALVSTIERKDLDFAFSFRKIYEPDKTYVTDDNCESLGLWPIWTTHGKPRGPQYLVDTSSYLFRRHFIQRTCHLWHSGAWGEDRRYFLAVKDHARFDTSGAHSLCYRLGGNPKSVSREFFITGNEKQLSHYQGKLPWKNRLLSQR
jgi:glycosyltransferase involved in cell wall biosynthesis